MSFIKTKIGMKYFSDDNLSGEIFQGTGKNFRPGKKLEFLLSNFMLKKAKTRTR